MSMEKNSTDMNENSIETTELNTQEKIQEINYDEEVDNKIIEVNPEKDDKNIDVRNILNIDKDQYNNLLDVLVQDKNFTKEFLLRAQQNLLGQKTVRNNKPKETSSMSMSMPVQQPIQYNNTPKKGVVEERNDLNQEEYNVNDITLDEPPETQEIYVEEQVQNKETPGVVMERDKIQEEDICYNRLLKLVKQYKINKVFNILIEILNKSNIVCNNIDEEFIKEEIIDITKTIRKDVLFVYLMKIMSNNNKEPRQISSPIMYRETYIPPPKIYDNFPIGNLTFSKNKSYNEPNFQYRWKHFERKNGTIFCFFPKSKVNSSKCSLYCTKRRCDAKLKIDLEAKEITLIEDHNEHEGINIDKLKWEYPELEQNDLQLKLFL